MQIFYEKKGAISVFLSVILLPMLIVALLATDAARIYSAKSVIADAGEMAMNAALAQYNAKLKDEYGLIAMDKEPSSMQGDLEKYFTASLNGDGLSFGLLTLLFAVMYLRNSLRKKTVYVKEDK